jgi:hypothetical protein
VQSKHVSFQELEGLVTRRGRPAHLQIKGVMKISGELGKEKKGKEDFETQEYLASFLNSIVDEDHEMQGIHINEIDV